ncbi:2-dehydropantoate 2-reductase [Thalassobaculum sp.]|uniref:ketopantoate reductase family protein n=1 Tax=Thalassobaculum sp. TaxID=2022740 RepID=UPI0032EE93FF
MTGEGALRVCVFGAGAVGCYFGGLMARAGHDVTFVGRPAHVDAINRHGLLLETAAGREHVPARAAVDAAGIDRPDLVMVCVKSADTEGVARSLAGRLGPHTTVLSLQNGIDNAERFAAVAARSAVPAIVHAGTGMAGPGHVRHHGGGELVIGAAPDSAALAEVLAAAGIPTTVSDDIDAALWGKLVTNCAYNGLSAIGAIPYAPMLQTDGAREVMLGVVAECTAVAAACGVTLPADTAAQMLAVAERMPGQLSSTARDLLRGKPSEIDFLNGYVVRKGAEHGIPTPINLTLMVAVRLAEKGRPPAPTG